MKKAWAILAVVLVVALSVAAAAALRRDTGKTSLPDGDRDEDDVHRLPAAAR